ncbi:hypothetical protein Nepgr_001063 [Nepenthes gracilis]|uniref:Uncharacterized protein n=1 Tax=Nepenthes gracilis TaxID=150966 RepID=A0AAD3RWP3_NEPGR|nr:hypothetical protein Nepgr_001063 [Nepenthes gracilis]
MLKNVAAGFLEAAAGWWAAIAYAHNWFGLLLSSLLQWIAAAPSLSAVRNFFGDDAIAALILVDLFWLVDGAGAVPVGGCV